MATTVKELIGIINQRIPVKPAVEVYAAKLRRAHVPESDVRRAVMRHPENQVLIDENIAGMKVSTGVEKLTETALDLGIDPTEPLLSAAQHASSVHRTKVGAFGPARPSIDNLHEKIADRQKSKALKSSDIIFED